MTTKEEKALKFLRDISPQLYKFDYNEVKIWLNDYIPQVPVLLSRQTMLRRFKEDGWYRNPKGIHRARENTIIRPTATIKYPYQRVKDITHFPLDKLADQKEYGRANLPHEAMFYCSNYSAAACAESLTNGFVKDVHGRFNCYPWHMDN